MTKVPVSATVVIGRESFSARFRHELAPRSCAELQKLFPYSGEVIHARWSGEAVWSRLNGAWPAGLRLPREAATRSPAPGEILLFAGEQSEPELLMPYGAACFACQAGPLEGNPVLVIEDGLERLADLGREILQRGAMRFLLT